MRAKRCLALAVGVVVAAALGRASGTDWNQWRGPNRDGRIEGFSTSGRWPSKLTRSWKVEVGEGHASPLIVGQAAFCFSREGDDEVVRRLDLATGHLVWKDHYPAPYEVNPAASAHRKGPKSTPVYGGGRLYTLGISGILSCYDARSGKRLWRHEFSRQYKQTSPDFGTAMSPILDRGLLIAHVGGSGNGALTAFDSKSGEVRWRWTGDGPGYASPIIVTRDGVRQIVTQTQKLCVGIAVDSGRLLWSLPFPTSYDQNAVSPVVSRDLVVFAGIGQPTIATRISKTPNGWVAKKVWESRDSMMYLSTPVSSAGLIYGMSMRRSGQLFSLDAATGKVLWTNAGRVGDNAVVLDAGGAVVVLTTTADLFVFKKHGNELAEEARYQVADSPTWATPAFADGHILVKDKTSLVLWDVRT